MKKEERAYLSFSSSFVCRRNYPAKPPPSIRSKMLKMVAAMNITQVILIAFSPRRKKLASNDTRKPPISGTVIMAYPNHIKEMSPIEINMLAMKPTANNIRRVLIDLFEWLIAGVFNRLVCRLGELKN